jgi:hypothetical protein
MAQVGRDFIVTPLTGNEVAELAKEAIDAGVNAAQGLDILEKTLTTAGVPFRQNLSDLVTLAVQQRTPLRNLFRRVRQAGGAQVEWFALTQLVNLTQAAFGEGNLPATGEPNYGITRPTGYEGYSLPPRRAIFKPIGYLVQVTAQAQLVGANFQSVLAAAIEYAVINTAQSEERLLIKGDSTANSAEFDGLNKWIVTNVIDKNGAPLTWADILEASQAIYLRGGTPRYIVAGPREVRTISQQYLNAVRPIEVGVAAPWGIAVKRVMTDFGEMEVILSQYLVPENRGELTNVSDVFILDSDHVTTAGGVLPGQAIEVHELLPMEAWVFPMQPTLVTPCVVWEMVTLAVRAQEWQAKIINIGVQS